MSARAGSELAVDASVGDRAGGAIVATADIGDLERLAVYAKNVLVADLDAR